MPTSLVRAGTGTVRVGRLAASGAWCGTSMELDDVAYFARVVLISLVEARNLTVKSTSGLIVSMACGNENVKRTWSEARP